MQETIEKATELVRELAEKYEPKHDSNWFEYEAIEGGSIGTFKEDQGTYCEDCCEKRKQEILDDPEIEFPDDFKELIISCETSKENENFLHCDSCGEIIECAVIWTFCELNHWAEIMTDDDWVSTKNSTYCYYEVFKILEQCYGAAEEYPKECLIIAEKVLKYWGNE